MHLEPLWLKQVQEQELQAAGFMIHDICPLSIGM